MPRKKTLILVMTARERSTNGVVLFTVRNFIIVVIILFWINHRFLILERVKVIFILNLGKKFKRVIFKIYNLSIFRINLSFLMNLKLK